MSAKWTPEMTARARELLAKATPRPYTADLDYFGAMCEKDDKGIEACISAGAATDMLFTSGTDLAPTEPDGANWARARQGQELKDAQLLAEAPTLLQAALAEVERLHSLLATSISTQDYQKLSAELRALRGRADERAQERDLARTEADALRVRVAAAEARADGFCERYQEQCARNDVAIAGYWAERDAFKAEVERLATDLADIRADLTADQAEQLAGSENQNQVIDELRAERDTLRARVAELKSIGHSSQWVCGFCDQQSPASEDEALEHSKSCVEHPGNKRAAELEEALRQASTAMESLSLAMTPRQLVQHLHDIQVTIDAALAPKKDPTP